MVEARALPLDMGDRLGRGDPLEQPPDDLPERDDQQERRLGDPHALEQRPGPMVMQHINATGKRISMRIEKLIYVYDQMSRHRLANLRQ